MSATLLKVYVRDYSPGAYAVSVVCLKCGKARRLSEMLIDPRGPAFQAYYCPECLPEAAIRWPNNESSNLWLVSRSQRDGSFTPLRQLQRSEVEAR